MDWIKYAWQIWLLATAVVGIGIHIGMLIVRNKKVDEQLIEHKGNISSLREDINALKKICPEMNEFIKTSNQQWRELNLRLDGINKQLVEFMRNDAVYKHEVSSTLNVVRAFMPEALAEDKGALLSKIISQLPINGNIKKQFIQEDE